MAKNPTQGDDQDDFSGVRNEDGSIKRAGLARTAKLSPFGLAFDEARKAGDKTFEFKGKKYTTEMAKPKAKPKADTSRANEVPPAPKQKDEGKTASGVAREARGIKSGRAGAMGRDPSRYGKPVTLDELGFKKGGAVSSASKRADGCAKKGKTKGRMV
jgi:hypothetical protein